MIVGRIEFAPQVHIAPMHDIEKSYILAENEKLREVLEKIASLSQTDNLLWWQIEARKALTPNALYPHSRKLKYLLQTGADTHILHSYRHQGI
jgi:hypothetical protein